MRHTMRLLAIVVALFGRTAGADERLAAGLGAPKNFHPQVEAYKAEHGGKAPPPKLHRQLLETERMYDPVRPWGNSVEAAGMMGKNLDGSPLSTGGAKNSNSDAQKRARRMARAAQRRATWGG